MKQKGKKFSLPSREIKKASRSDMSYEAYEIHRPVHKTGSYMCVYIYVCVCVCVYMYAYTHFFRLQLRYEDLGVYYWFSTLAAH